MTRRTQPTERLGRDVVDAVLDAVAPVAPPDAATLPVMCDQVGRTARAIAARIDRAAHDLAGPANATNGPTLALGHQDVWRFEVEVARAITDLRAMSADVASWRHDRDAEVARATAEAAS